MSPQAPRLEGVPGTEAVGSKRGYYYQDVATALAWTHLRDGETLVSRSQKTSPSMRMTRPRSIN